MGFDIERFLDPVEDDFKCGICFGVLEDPLVTTCGHVFCSQCLVHWIAENGTCPLTCEQLAIDDLKKIPPLTRLISLLNIRCCNFQRGCPAILRIESIQTHQRKCQYAEGLTSGGKIMDNSDSPELSVQVVVCEKGCGLPLLFHDCTEHDCLKALQTHIASLQVKLTKVEHDKEQLSEKTTSREETLQDRILNLENELHSYQTQALNVERQLREYRSQIGYFQKLFEIRGEKVSFVEVFLERIDGSLGFNIMGGSEVISLKTAGGGGIVVSKIAEGGPASKPDGLQVHDRIIKVRVRCWF
ncbi:predicted protein [Nematostella vectensis]|uniref:Uncharacterized protein n=1 Tax=Nematostella vectensis TaxID=45351 RepID=A7RKF3_NEMVE|nr:predicted protein [Nematostella vectensis]|eukprot:XP_001640299.1 predicted protein [Nematostella vectensis]